jgi:hypothetical protein
MVLFGHEPRQIFCHFESCRRNIDTSSPVGHFSGLWAQKHILSRKDHNPRDKLPYLDVTWLGGSASGSYFQKPAPVPLFTDRLPLVARCRLRSPTSLYLDIPHAQPQLPPVGLPTPLSYPLLCATIAQPSSTSPITIHGLCRLLPASARW